MQRLLDIENLRTTFDIHVGKVQAVRGVNLHVDEGETVGIVGESGCGKSVSMLSVLHLLPDYAKISDVYKRQDGNALSDLYGRLSAERGRRKRCTRRRLHCLVRRKLLCLRT